MKHARRLRIKDLPIHQRPREKLSEKGKENLTNEELVALLLGSGTNKRNALALAKEMLQTHTIQTLPSLTVKQLCTIPGIGMSKATRIIAAIELGTRIYVSSSLLTPVIHAVSDLLPLVADIAGRHQEYVVGLYLNARNELLKKEIVSIGTTDSIQIHPRTILAPALKHPCTKIFLVHNHPSGNPIPSEDDVRFTVRIQEASILMGIELSDHVVICRNGYFSFREHELIFR